MPANHLKNIIFCPSCGGPEFSRGNTKRWHCRQCGFIYFHNAAAAVAAVLMHGRDILLTIRKSDPGKGMLDLPGGFVDAGESLETALTREISEELNCQLDGWQYLFSLPNRYAYKGIVYSTTDAFFKMAFDAKPDVEACDDVAGVVWMPVDQIDIRDIALDSIRKAIRRLVSLHT